MTFEQIQQNAIAEFEALELDDKPRIYIGTATCGRSAGALKIHEHLCAELERRNLDAQVIEVGCIGLCYLEPLIYIAKSGRPRICYSQVTISIVSQLITDYIINDNHRPDLAVCSIGKGRIDGIPGLADLPMFQRQVRIALRNCGYIDPANINHYIACGGYSGLARALTMNPDEVTAEVSKSGLRGRGGTGFHTGTKWKICHDAPGTEKYLICNAADGNTSRTILESDPHSVLEGMLIGAYAVGAAHGYIYINAEHTLAIARLKTALKQMENYMLSNDKVLGSNFCFQIEVKGGAGDLICGEETALIQSMEGKRGMAYPRPPFPTTSGLGSKPTIINNVETWANVSAILQKSAEWYASYGTMQSKGTKVFTLGGKVPRAGLIEVPMGMSLHQIVYDIGGAVPDSGDLKAVLIGGTSGGCLPASVLSMPVDYEHINAAGANMGSGNITVTDSATCMVNLAKHCLSFTQAESCGKCVICREGTSQMLEILTDITEGKGKPDDIELLLELGDGLKVGALCALGKTAPNPVLTTIRHFREEYEAHVKRKRCPAKRCSKLISSSVMGT